MDPLGQRNGKQSTIWNLLWGMFVAFLFAIFGRNIPSTWFETIVYLVVDIPSFFSGSLILVFFQHLTCVKKCLKMTLRGT
jgi:ABC-type dipeptide/oligopeptide/nickel transport system permease component